LVNEVAGSAERLSFIANNFIAYVWDHKCVLIGIRQEFYKYILYNVAGYSDTNLPRVRVSATSN
jgi:hypothetical protein